MRALIFHLEDVPYTLCSFQGACGFLTPAATLVETSGFEPLTSCVQGSRSPD